MGIGTRNTSDEFFPFRDTDAIINSFNSFRRKKSKKKSKSNRKKNGHRIVRRSKRTRRSKHSPTRKGKRKGMSKEFLRNLRRKHGLGEFKKR